MRRNYTKQEVEEFIDGLPAFWVNVTKTWSARDPKTGQYLEGSVWTDRDGRRWRYVTRSEIFSWARSGKAPTNKLWDLIVKYALDNGWSVVALDLSGAWTILEDGGLAVNRRPVAQMSSKAGKAQGIAETRGDESTVLDLTKAKTKVDQVQERLTQKDPGGESRQVSA